ncbi:MAG: cobalt ECF transporter T component CbiQ [Pelagimonas sp.]|jgi:cobalt/nickel transport system permease protein
MGHVLSSGEKTLSETGASLGGGRIGMLDARIRIVVTMAFAITVVGLSQIPVLILALCVSLFLLTQSNLPARRTLKRMAMMDGFIFFMLGLMPFTTPGEAMFTVFGFPATWEGLFLAIEIGLTANAVVLAVLTLLGTLEPVALGHALYALKCPERLVHLLMFTIRYIEVLREEYLRLRTSMKMRCFQPRTNWHTYRSYGYLVGMMLVRAVERSERILGAMKCRGFTGRIILLEQFRLSRYDHIFATCAALVMLLLIGLELSHVFA